MQGAPHRSNSPLPLSQIEKSVSQVLVATKQLLETLTKWSRHEATDTDVSDAYTRLGYEFKSTCRAFATIGVDTSDLGNVPELLREILESMLSQEASPECLDQYLPKIKDIIITLLHGLKRQQHKIRQKRSNESLSAPPNRELAPIQQNLRGEYTEATTSIRSELHDFSRNLV